MTTIQSIILTVMFIVLIVCIVLGLVGSVVNENDIDSLKTENKRLKEKVDYLEKKVSILKSKDELLDMLISLRSEETLPIRVKPIPTKKDKGGSKYGCKSEAIKEFAEKVKDKHKHNKTSVVSLVTVFDNIDNLVKEMTDGEEAN